MLNDQNTGLTQIKKIACIEGPPLRSSIPLPNIQSPFVPPTLTHEMLLTPPKMKSSFANGFDQYTSLSLRDTSVPFFLPMEK